MNPIAQFFRVILMVLLAFAGFAMAVIFLVSTAVALGVLYLVAKVRGQPFAPAVFWQARRQAARWQFSQGRWRAPGQAGPGPSASATPSPNGAAATRPKGFRPQSSGQVIDVEVRDIR